MSWMRASAVGRNLQEMPCCDAKDWDTSAFRRFHDDLGGRRIRVAGPELLSFPEAARRLSAVYGKKIRFLAIPLLLPRTAWYVTRPLIRLSSTLYFVHTMLGFIQLLNKFPYEMALEALEDHGISYAPSTIRRQHWRWRQGGGWAVATMRAPSNTRLQTDAEVRLAPQSKAYPGAAEAPNVRRPIQSRSFLRSRSL